MVGEIQISHTNNDIFENAFNFLIIVNMSTSSFDYGAKSAWSADHWPLIVVWVSV